MLQKLTGNEDNDDEEKGLLSDSEENGKEY